MRILVTGASSELGQHICTLLGEQNHEVIAIDRKAFPTYSLEEGLNASLFVDIDAIFHLAYDRTAKDYASSRSINVGGTSLLAEAAFDSGIKRFVYISTESAIPGSKSIYGRVKYETECSIQKIPNVVIIRVGTILGNTPMGPIKKILEYSNSRLKFLFVPKFWSQLSVFYITTLLEIERAVVQSLQRDSDSLITCRIDNRKRTFHEVVEFQSRYAGWDSYASKIIVTLPLSLNFLTKFLQFFASLDSNLSKTLDSLKSLQNS